MMRYSFKLIKKVGMSPYTGWSGFLFLHHISVPVVWLVSNFTKLTPNQVTLIQFLVRLTCIYPFFIGTKMSFVIGGALYALCVVLDDADGQLARLKEQKTNLGAHMDPMLDIVGDFLCFVAIIYGQFLITDENVWVLLGMVLPFMNIFVGIENMHLQMVRSKITTTENTEDSQKTEYIKDPLPTSRFAIIIRKMRSFQKRHGVSFFSIDITDIRFIIFVVGAISGFMKECLFLGLALITVKMIWEKAIQIWKRDAVFFN